MAESPQYLDALSLDDFEKMLRETLAKIPQLKAANTALREENSRLMVLPKKRNHPVSHAGRPVS